jgi:Zn-dependent protease
MDSDLLLGKFFLLLLLAFFPVLYVSSFFHELGHAVCARLAGFVVGSFGLGTGRPFWVAGCRGVRVYLCLHRPFQGITFVTIPQLLPERWRNVCFLSGGVLAHLLLTVTGLFLFVVLPWGKPFALLFAVLNALLALANLIPVTVKVGHSSLRSDGAQILQVLLHGSLSAPVPARLGMLSQFRGLWQATGDLRTLRVYLLSAAATWLDLGDPGRAGELIAEGQGLPADPAPAFAAYAEGLRGLTLTEAGCFPEAAAALDEAEKGFARLDHPAGLFLVRWWRAVLFLRRGEAPRAVQDLDALASHPFAARRPTLRHALLTERVVARAALPEGDGLGEVLAEYEAMPTGERSPTYKLLVYRAVARSWLSRGNTARALPAYRRALRAVRDLDDALVDPADRSGSAAARRRWWPRCKPTCAGPAGTARPTCWTCSSRPWRPLPARRRPPADGTDWR